MESLSPTQLSIMQILKQHDKLEFHELFRLLNLIRPNTPWITAQKALEALRKYGYVYQEGKQHAPYSILDSGLEALSKLEIHSLIESKVIERWNRV